MKQTHDSASTSRRAQLLSFIAGWGSLFDLWPAVKYEEVYPHKAKDVLRRSLENVGDAFWIAFHEVTGEQEEDQAKVQSFDAEESRADEPVGN